MLMEKFKNSLYNQFIYSVKPLKLIILIAIKKFKIIRMRVHPPYSIHFHI